MSNMYNLMYGVNPSTFLILPMLGKHPDEYPRFRDCFVGDSGDTIVVLTRIGGNNRNCDYGEEDLIKDPNFIKTWDWDRDTTYGYYEFKVPDKWRKDFDLIVKENKLSNVSLEYQNELIRVYPKLEEKFKNLFKRK